MNKEEIERKVIPINYRTLASETIIFASTIYAVLSLILVGVVFRFWLSDCFEVYIISIYAFLSLIFLIYMGIQSYRRTKLNKLPSNTILELCYLVKENSNYKNAEFVNNGCWNVTLCSFNDHAMKSIFGTEISKLIPAHDYFSFMLSEKYITVSSITDNSNDINKNTLNISPSISAIEKIKIYEDSVRW